MTRSDDQSFYHSIEAGFDGLGHLLGGHGAIVDRSVVEVADHSEPKVDCGFLLEKFASEVLFPVFDAF